MGGRKSAPEPSDEQKELEALQAAQLKREQEKAAKLEKEAATLATARRKGGAVGAGSTAGVGNTGESVFRSLLGG